MVDDDTDYWEVTAYVLRRAVFDISIAPTAKEAEEACKQGQVELVLLNGQLKGHAGLELCRVLAKTSGVPVLVFSTNRDESDILAAFAARADDYIIRPFSTRPLVARLEAIHQRATMRPLQLTAVPEGRQCRHRPRRLQRCCGGPDSPSDKAGVLLLYLIAAMPTESSLRHS